MFDCSGEATDKVVKTGTVCSGADCNATTCCGICALFGFLALPNDDFGFEMINTNRVPFISVAHEYCMMSTPTV